MCSPRMVWEDLPILVRVSCVTLHRATRINSVAVRPCTVWLQVQVQHTRDDKRRPFMRWMATAVMMGRSADVEGVLAVVVPDLLSALP